MPEQVTPLQKLLREYQQLPEFMGSTLTDVNQQGIWNSTPLHIAIYRERPHEVKILLDAGADPNSSGEYGERPLHVAVNCRNGAIVEQLVRAGAKCELRDGRERDVWRYARMLNYEDELASIIRQINSRGNDIP